jgi:Family of unknown function (DUF6886)
MLSDLTTRNDRLFHVSETAGINLFQPRQSPSYFPGITGNVVFAVSESLLHNYLLPRECPRVTWYAGSQTTNRDKNVFMLNTGARYTIVVEAGWYQRIKEATLYCYEFAPESFTLLDSCAGYHVSYQPVPPLSITIVEDIITELLSRNVELRFVPSILTLADAVSKSTLNFSLIRMRNAR